MRKPILLAIFCAALFYAPVPITAQHGGGPTPLIPVVDMPQAGGGATAPSEPPLEVDPDAVPELVSPEEAAAEAEENGGASAPAPAATPEPEPVPAAPEPEPAPTPTAEPALTPKAAPPAVEPAQAPDDPTGEVPDQEPTDTPDPGEDEDEQDEEEFEEEFDDIPEAGDPDADVTPQATVPAGSQLPRTGADLPALLVSGLSLLVAGMALRGLVAGRA